MVCELYLNKAVIKRNGKGQGICQASLYDVLFFIFEAFKKLLESLKYQEGPES